MAKKYKRGADITLDFTEVYNRYYKEFGRENIVGTIIIPKKISLWTKFKDTFKHLWNK